MTAVAVALSCATLTEVFLQLFFFALVLGALPPLSALSLSSVGLVWIPVGVLVTWTAPMVVGLVMQRWADRTGCVRTACQHLFALVLLYALLLLVLFLVAVLATADSALDAYYRAWFLSFLFYLWGLSGLVGGARRLVESHAAPLVMMEFCVRRQATLLSEEAEGAAAVEELALIPHIVEEVFALVQLLSRVLAAVVGSVFYWVLPVVSFWTVPSWGVESAPGEGLAILSLYTAQLQRVTLGLFFFVALVFTLCFTVWTTHYTLYGDYQRQVAESYEELHGPHDVSDPLPA